MPGYVCRMQTQGAVMTFDGLSYQVPQLTGAFYLLNEPNYGWEVQVLLGACYIQSSQSCIKAVAVQSQYYDNWVVYNIPGINGNKPTMDVYYYYGSTRTHYTLKNGVY